MIDYRPTGFTMPFLSRRRRDAATGGGLRERELGDLNAAIEQARQELGAMDSKWLRANDAAILQKIRADQTIFTGDHPSRRTIERFGTLAAGMFGSPRIEPAPLGQPTFAARPGPAYRPPTDAGKAAASTLGVNPAGRSPAYNQELEGPTDTGPGRYERGLARIAAQAGQPITDPMYMGGNRYGSYLPTARPQGGVGWTYTTEPGPENNWAGWGPPPAGWTTRSEIPRFGQSFEGEGLPWPPPGFSPEAPAQENPAPPTIEPGYREVDEDTGINYEFLGGDAADQNSWREVP